MTWDKSSGKSFWDISDVNVLWNILQGLSIQRNTSLCKRLIARIESLEDLENTYGYIPKDWKTKINAQSK